MLSGKGVDNLNPACLVLPSIGLFRVNVITQALTKALLLTIQNRSIVLNSFVHSQVPHRQCLCQSKTMLALSPTTGLCSRNKETDEPIVSDSAPFCLPPLSIDTMFLFFALISPVKDLIANSFTRYMYNRNYTHTQTTSYTHTS